MTDDVTEAFAIWKRKQEYDKKKLGEKWGKNNELMREYPHLFRHTFVTRCYEAGVDPMTIALIVGHSREKMVIHYTHISKEFQKKDFVKYEEQEKERILSDSE